VHGAEAEELRSGIESILWSEENGSGDLKDALRRLLDRVDTRDSLARLEARPRGK
jgi:hypothetical protein